MIKQAADTGDTNAIESLSEVGEAIGNGLADLVSICNPGEVISVIGQDATLMGAAAIVIGYVLNDPTEVKREVMLTTP